MPTDPKTLPIPPVARLLLEVAALRLKIKVLERDVADLKAARSADAE